MPRTPNSLVPCALLLAAVVGCDPGAVCTPNGTAEVPDGVDPCDPSTYPAPLTQDTGTVDADHDAAGADAADGSGESPTYPEAPYGTEEGDTAANRRFAVAGGGELAFADLYADPDARLVLVSTAAGWCTACREEQPALAALHDEFSDDGLAVLVAIFEDDFASPATDAYASGWRDHYGLPFPVLVDDRNQLGAFYDTSLAPMNLFVDGTTMEILAVSIGFDEGLARALIADRLGGR